MALTIADYESALLLDRDVVQEVILREEGATTPLGAALLAKGITDTMTPKFEWYIEGLPNFRTQVNNGGAAYTDATTSIVVDSAAAMTPGTVILFEATGEIGLVVAVNTGTNTLTVRRGLGDTAAAAGSVADNAFVRGIGVAAGEGASAFAYSSSLPSAITNYVQIFRETIEISGTAGASATKANYGRGRKRQIKLREMLNGLERSLLFGDGQDSATDANGKVVRTTRGVIKAVATNVTNIGGNLTRALLNDFLMTASAYGSASKLLMAGPDLVNDLTTLFEGKLRVSRLSEAINLNVQEIVAPSGVSFGVVLSRAMSGPYARQGLVIDVEQAMLRGLPDRGQPRLVENIQLPGDDTLKDEWFAELGLEYGDERAHARIYGVTGTA